MLDPEENTPPAASGNCTGANNGDIGGESTAVLERRVLRDRLGSLRWSLP